MRKLLFLGVLGFYLCIFFAGCRTLDTLSRVKTGHVGLKEAWDSLLADDESFQETFW